MTAHKSHLPVDPIGRYRELLPAEEIPVLEAAVRRPPPPAVRFNPLKSDTRQIVEEFRRKKNWQLQPVPFCADGFTLLESPTPPGRTLEARLGYFYIQDAASMLPVELFEESDNPHPLILDLTAAPGGKSTHLAARFMDAGLLIANDGTASRIPALSAALKTWGAVNSAVTNFPGEKFGLWFPDTFDIVLLDAPCSMENLHPGDRNRREIKAAERSRLAQRQVQLLLSALQACRPGGQVVYSTCTLAPEEDEAVLDTVLQRTGKSVRLTAAGQRLGIQAPGLTAAFGQNYSTGTEKSLRLWPHRLGTSGFFSAHLRKDSSIARSSVDAAIRPASGSHLPLLSRKDQDVLRGILSTAYGFELDSLLDEYDLAIRTFRQSVYIVPQRLEAEFPGLPVNSCGLRLGDYSEAGFELSLEWATRFSRCVTSNRLALSPEEAVRWARGEDLPLKADHPVTKGTILVVADPENRVLGTGRISSRGIKNLLPRHLALKS